MSELGRLLAALKNHTPKNLLTHQPMKSEAESPPPDSPQEPPPMLAMAPTPNLHAELMRGQLGSLGQSSTRFPVKLWEIVSTDQTGSICWNVEGNGFIVDHENFEHYYLKTMTFKTTKITSFVRQLNLYGFRKAKKNHLSPETWESYTGGSYFMRKHSDGFKKSRVGVLREYRHTHFLRDKPDYLTYVRRISDSGRKSEKSLTRKPKSHYRTSATPADFPIASTAHGAYGGMVPATGYPEYEWFQAGSSTHHINEIFGVQQPMPVFTNGYADQVAFWQQFQGYNPWFPGSMPTEAGEPVLADMQGVQVAEEPSLPGIAEFQSSMSHGQPVDPGYVSPGTSFADASCSEQHEPEPRPCDYVIYWDQGEGQPPQDELSVSTQELQPVPVEGYPPDDSLDQEDTLDATGPLEGDFEVDQDATYFAL